MNKKAQSQIITTVLIILLVLAAVVIVWQVVRTTVTEGTSTLEERTECIGLDFDITNVTNTSTSTLDVEVTRTSGGPTDSVKLVLLVDGTRIDSDLVYSTGSGSLGQLESTKITHTGSSGDYATIPGKVQIGGTTGEDDVACDYLGCKGKSC